MSFSQSTITDVTWKQVDGDILVSWTSSDPDGTIFQVYLDNRLAWHGAARACSLPPIASTTQSVVSIGTVGVGEDLVNFASSLPVPPGAGQRIKLSWMGGTYEADDLAKFNIYMGATPGGAVSYTTPVATVTAYPGGLLTDGFGMGGFGMGGFGRASASWSWTSGPLARGTWNVAIKPADGAGNEGTAVTGSATVAGPPNPLPRFADNKRVHSSYNLSGPRQVTLTWNVTT